MRASQSVNSLPKESGGREGRARTHRAAVVADGWLRIYSLTSRKRKTLYVQVAGPPTRLCFADGNVGIFSRKRPFYSSLFFPMYCSVSQRLWHSLTRSQENLVPIVIVVILFGSLFPRCPRMLTLGDVVVQQSFCCGAAPVPVCFFVGVFLCSEQGKR